MPHAETVVRELRRSSRIRRQNGHRRWPLTGQAFFLLLCAACEPAQFQDGFSTPAIDSHKWQMDMESSCEISLVPGDPRTDGSALRISAPEDSRCEIVPRLYSEFVSVFRREPVDVDRWYVFSVLVEESGDMSAVPESVNKSDNTIVAQWHSSPDNFPRKEKGRGPPLALRIFDGEWVISYGWEEKRRSSSGYRATRRHWSGTLDTNRWTRWVFHVKWSLDPDGLTEIWKDGQLIVQKTGPNSYNDFRGVYWKLGVYHPPVNQVLLLDDISISNDPPASAVQPSRLPRERGE